MKISKYRKDSDYYSSSASSINRSLALSGIAMIWLFTQDEQSNFVVQKNLVASCLKLHPVCFWELVISTYHFLKAVYYGKIFKQFVI